jgi:hypothetical protein
MTKKPPRTAVPAVPGSGMEVTSQDELAVLDPNSHAGVG